MVDTNREIRRAVDTGKVAFGTKECKKNLLKGLGELIIISKNMPGNERELLEHMAETEGKKVYAFRENGLVLGSICGKPFVVSSMVVLDKGKSNVLELE